MKLENIGEVIATRRLYVQDVEDSQTEITVQIGRPQPFPDPPDDYFVPYQILGIGTDDVRYATGVDAIQSLQLVMQVIGDDLAARGRRSGKTIVWEAGQDEHDLGFPVYHST